MNLNLPTTSPVLYQILFTFTSARTNRAMVSSQHGQLTYFIRTHYDGLFTRYSCPGTGTITVDKDV